MQALEASPVATSKLHTKKGKTYKMPVGRNPVRTLACSDVRPVSVCCFQILVGPTDLVVENQFLYRSQTDVGGLILELKYR